MVTVDATALASCPARGQLCAMMQLLFVGMAAALLVGCEKQSPDSSSATAPQADRKTFQVKGVVVELEPDGKTARIKHEEIPGYMAAMTMPLEVRNTNELAGLEPGDSIEFRMIVTEDDGWIDQVKKLDVPRVNVAPTTGQFRLVRDVEPLNDGDALPEYHFIDQDGKPITTSQFKGQALGINFLFTRCPFPTFCPLMAKNFAATQNALLADASAPTNWHLLSITIDPEFDSPSLLKSYGSMYGRNPAHWTFATGELIDITAIAEQFGLTFWRDTNGLPSHNLRTVVIDASGRVQKNFVGNEWSSAELTQEMIKAAAVK